MTSPQFISCKAMSAHLLKRFKSIKDIRSACKLPKEAQYLSVTWNCWKRPNNWNVRTSFVLSTQMFWVIFYKCWQKGSFMLIGNEFQSFGPATANGSRRKKGRPIRWSGRPILVKENGFTEDQTGSGRPRRRRRGQWCRWCCAWGVPYIICEQTRIREQSSLPICISLIGC